MRQRIPSHGYALLLLLFLLLQSCSGSTSSGNTSSGNSSNFKTLHSSANGQQVAANQDALFKGTLYFTQGHNLFALDGTRTARQLTSGRDVRDPAVSPDGKRIAYIVRYKNYSDLEHMPLPGGNATVFLSGQGQFYTQGSFIKSTYNWFAQPTWSPDGSHLLFLSDLQKNFYWASLGSPFNSAPFLDLQVFSLPLANPNANPQAVAYASYGDGGDRDIGFRSNHPNQIVYTHYAYDASGTQQVIQVFLEDATAIPNHPYAYSPERDAGVALTPANIECIQPAVSPDGNALAYIRREHNGQMSLAIMPFPNGDVTSAPNASESQQRALQPYGRSSVLLTQQFMGQPVWSPDGRQLAYISYDNKQFNIWLVSLEIDPHTGAYKTRGSPVQLTAGGVDGDSRPFWTA